MKFPHSAIVLTMLLTSACFAVRAQDPDMHIPHTGTDAVSLPSVDVSEGCKHIDFDFNYSGPHLVKVYDSAADVVYTGASDFCDAADLAVEYTYDANGNTTSDANKGITSIEYNALNLPAKITFTDGSRMENTYSADGTLLRRYTNVSVTHTPPILHAFSGGIGTQLPHVIEASDDHIGPLTYHNGSLERIDTPNGFIDGDDEIYYYVKDYQGNIRQVTDADGTVLQDNHYYPYGMLMAESSDILAANLRSMPSQLSPSTPATVAVSNPYLYGGKEYLTFKGANYLDFSARYYDQASIQFTSIDGLGEKHPEYFDYLYCNGNPIIFIDPSGLDPNRVEDLINDICNLYNNGNLNFISICNLISQYSSEILQRVAVGWELVGGKEVSAGTKVDANAILGCVVFLGGDDADYLYEYSGGSVGGGAELSIGNNLYAGKNFYVAVQDGNDNHKYFEGPFHTGSLSFSAESGALTAAINLGITGSVYYSWSYIDNKNSNIDNKKNKWHIFGINISGSLGVGVSSPYNFGASYNYGEIKFHKNQQVGEPKKFHEKILSWRKIFKFL